MEVCVCVCVVMQGRESSFATLSIAPIFLAQVPVGLMSGYLLATYLPEQLPPHLQHRHHNATFVNATNYTHTHSSNSSSSDDEVMVTTHVLQRPRMLWLIIGIMAMYAHHSSVVIHNTLAHVFVCVVILFYSLLRV